MKDAHVPFEDGKGVSMSETEKERKLCRWNGRNKSIVQLWLLVVVAIAHVGILASWIEWRLDDESFLWFGKHLGKQDKNIDGKAKIRYKHEGKVRPTAHFVHGKIRIEVIANKRLQSLRRLLDSLEKADYFGFNVPLDIHLEADEPEDLIHYAVGFKWPFGPKQIHLRHSHGGLINAVLESWYPASIDEMAVMLEDDIEVSPYFFQWILGVLEKYATPKVSDPHFVGISLYTPRVGELKLPRPKYNFTRILLENNMFEPAALRFQLPCSWGALYFAPFWMELRAYVSFRQSRGLEEDRFVIPGSRSTGWSASWKKFAFELFWSKGYYLLYPILLNQSSFATNHLEAGEHILQTSRTHLPEDFTVPLVRDANDVEGLFRHLSGCQLAVLPLLDIFGNPYKTHMHNQNLLPLEEGTKPANRRTTCTKDMHLKYCKDYNGKILEQIKSVDKFTVLLAHFWTPQRAKLLVQLLDHYARTPSVDKVLVVWHNPLFPCPTDFLIQGTPVIFLCQKCDSLNNRYAFDMRITTHAVFIVDDDIHVHHSDLERLFALWRQRTSNLVGFFPRWFQPLNSTAGQYIQKAQNLDHELGYSFILTKAMMVQAHYLYEYRCGLGVDLQTVVDLSGNAEDLAFNLMVRKLIGRTPALFLQPKWPIVDYGTYAGGGLHTRSKSHDGSRTGCLLEFMTLLDLKSWDLCCVSRIVDGPLEKPGHKFKQGHFTDIVPYVYNPCKYVNTTEECSFVPENKLTTITETDIVLQM